jgi:hypothetical protein
MGNATSTTPPVQRAPRAADAPDKERRQVNREVGRARSQVDNDIRRLVRAKIAGELRTRPVTSRDIEEIRLVLLTLAPPCPEDTHAPGGCSLPGPIHDALVIVEATEGRTFTLQEVTLLHTVIRDDVAILNPKPRPHRRIANPSKGSTCGCHSPSCSECAAASFSPTPVLMTPWYRQMNPAQ